MYILRKHKGGREWVSQMLTFPYVGGGGSQESCLCNQILEEFILHALLVSAFAVNHNHFKSVISNFCI